MSALAAIAAASLLVGAPWLVSTWRRVGAYAYPAGRAVRVVSERNTTRACSSCGSLTGPSGLDMLVVRQWECVECGDTHDRDVNAARNILLLGSGDRASVRGNESSDSSVPLSRLRKRRRETGTETMRTAA